MKKLLYMIYMGWLAAGSLQAQSTESTEPTQSASGAVSGIRIVPQSLHVSNDSVRINLTIYVSGIYMPSAESLRLVFELKGVANEVSLPSVLLSGAQRARFDRREEAVNPALKKPTPYHTWCGIARDEQYTLNYRVSLPYAAWMPHASLCLRQISKNCCTEQELAFDVLTKDINLATPTTAASPALVTSASATKIVPTPKPSIQVASAAPVVVPAPTASASPVESTASTISYITYPYRNASVFDPAFADNWPELDYIDRLLTPLLEDPKVTFDEIRIIYYLPATPDKEPSGKALATSRVRDFRTWLVRAYRLQDYPVTAVAKIDDGSGQGRVELILFYTKE